MASYRGTADAMTRAALQTVVALPADLSKYNDTVAAAAANSVLDAANTTKATRANLAAATIYTNTNLVATVNDGLNANRYISSLITSEQNRVSDVNSTVRNEQFKLRSKLLGFTYLRNYYVAGTWVVMLTLTVSMIMLVVAALWRGGAIQLLPFAALIGVLLLAYMVTVVKVTSKMPTLWDKRQWRVRNQDSLMKTPSA
jgi:hypothetical protein